MEENYTVFQQKSRSGSGPNLTDHFNEWGWFSFLKYVAEKGTIFYKQNGLSNLDNIKKTQAHSILVWASEQSDYDDIIGRYYDSLNN